MQWLIISRQQKCEFDLQEWRLRVSMYVLCDSVNIKYG